MPITYDPIFDPSAPRKAVRIVISAPVLERLEALRTKIEGRFRIRLELEELIRYLCEKALERLEDWERRTRPS